MDEDGRRSQSDTVWQGELVGEARPCYVVILVEFQRTQQWLMPFRVLCYVVQILRRWRREREEAHRRLNKERRQAGLPALPMPKEPFPLIFPMVIYNGPDEWRMPLNMNQLFGDVEADFLRYLPSLEYAVFDLHRLTWDQPELVSSLSAQWGRFMQAGSNEENIAAFDALMRILDSAEYRDLEELRETFFRWFSLSLRENGMPWEWLDQMRNEPLPEVSRMFTTMSLLRRVLTSFFRGSWC